MRKALVATFMCSTVGLLLPVRATAALQRRLAQGALALNTDERKQAAGTYDLVRVEARHVPATLPWEPKGCTMTFYSGRLLLMDSTWLRTDRWTTRCAGVPDRPESLRRSGRLERQADTVFLFKDSKAARDTSERARLMRGWDDLLLVVGDSLSTRFDDIYPEFVYARRTGPARSGLLPRTGGGKSGRRP